MNHHKSDTHHHHDQMGHGHNHHAIKNIKVAFFLNLFFTLIEIWGGFLTNSMAILSDALHDFGDTLIIGFSLYFIKRSQKSRDQKYSYGYKRLSLLGAFISAIILSMGSILIVLKTIPRLVNPQDVHAPGMFLLAVFGVLVNGLAVWRLQKGQSPNERVVRLHLLEDVFGWLAVLIGSVLIYWFNWLIIDPLLSLAIAGYILYNAIKNIRDFIRIFLQGIPKDISLETIGAEISQIKDVLSAHDLHIWSMDGQYNVLSAHLVIKENLTKLEIIAIKNQVRQILHKYNITHETLELEYADETCSFENC
jgi:cobalt-zinc-cadmium efflux system protein